MIKSLHIKNLALIEEAAFELGEGLNVLTGETGAGKTVIVNALDLILGGRSDVGKVRSGTRQLELEAVFSLKEDSPVLGLLDELGFRDDPSERELIIRRVISQDGKSRCWANGHLCTTSILSRIGEYLVDIHGQHEHQRLLRPSNHLEYLDRLGGDVHLRKVEDFTGAYQEWQRLAKKEEEIRLSDTERFHLIDLLRFQVEEIEKVNPQENEFEELVEERRRIQHAEELFSQASEALSLLVDDQDTGGSDLLGRAIHLLERAGFLDPKLSHYSSELEELKSRVDEIAFELRNYLENLQFDPDRLQRVEERIYNLRLLQKKYGENYGEIMNFYQRAKDRLLELENYQSTLERVEEELALKKEEVVRRSRELTKTRKEIARILEREVNRELEELNMQGATFKVLHEERSEPGERGADLVEFQISPGKGEPYHPISRVASGGELSRIMLALKIVLARADEVHTLVFDEVDAGIGGSTAKVIGKKMEALSAYHQILNVTHLAQIASFAQNHYRIYKDVTDERVVTKIEPVENGERTQELARMLGGTSELAMKHAEELLSQARKTS